MSNITSLLFALVMNFLVGAQILDLPGIKDISDKYATFLTPATYAFSIWSVIYMSLVVFVVYQARDLFTPDRKNDLPRKIGPYFIIASIANGLWTYVFVGEWIGLSVIVILVLAISLYVLLHRLRIAIYDAPRNVIICVWWPLLLYTGWVTVAAVVAIASWLQSLDIVLSAVTAAIVLVILAASLITLLLNRNVRELVLASSWGIIAIGVQQAQMAEDRLVITTAFTVGVLLLASVVIHGYLNRHSSPFMPKSLRK